jgi:hypothetical protein
MGKKSVSEKHATRGVTVATSARPARTRTRTGATVPLDTLGAPGAYVCNWNGQLLRVPAAGLLGLNLVGREPLLVTKIRANPRVPLVKARSLAARLGCNAGF